MFRRNKGNSQRRVPFKFASPNIKICNYMYSGVLSPSMMRKLRRSKKEWMEKKKSRGSNDVCASPPGYPLPLPCLGLLMTGGYAGQEAEQAWRRRGCCCYSRHAACGWCRGCHAMIFVEKHGDVSASLLDHLGALLDKGPKAEFGIHSRR